MAEIQKFNKNNKKNNKNSQIRIKDQLYGNRTVRFIYPGEEHM